MGSSRPVPWTMDDLVFLLVRFFSFKNLVYVIILGFALPLMAWIFVAKNEPSMDFAAAMEMQVKLGPYSVDLQVVQMVLIAGYTGELAPLVCLDEQQMIMYWIFYTTFRPSQSL